MGILLNRDIGHRRLLKNKLSKLILISMDRDPHSEVSGPGPGEHAETRIR